MATAVSKLHELEGSDYEDVYLMELWNFKDPQAGVDGDDLEAAFILSDTGRMDLLERLRRREIHVVGRVDEDSTFEDLEFE